MRVFVLAVVFLTGVAATASAQQPQSTNTPVAPATRVFSNNAINSAVLRTMNTTPATIAPMKAPVPRGGKNFFKTPWPYLIAGGVIAGVVIAMNTGSSNGTTGGY